MLGSMSHVSHVGKSARIASMQALPKTVAASADRLPYYEVSAVGPKSFGHPRLVWKQEFAASKKTRPTCLVDVQLV
jgi:hypothetical protein